MDREELAQDEKSVYFFGILYSSEGSGKRSPVAIKPMPIDKKLTDKMWLFKNEGNLKDLLPSKWMSINKLNPIQLINHMKGLGLVISSLDELQEIMSHLETINMVLRFGNKIRCNPETIFKIDLPVNTGLNAITPPPE